MKYEDMIVGVRYMVTKDSNDLTFQKNDSIRLEKNGDITGSNSTCGFGWIKKENIPEAIIGMEMEPDKKYAIDLIEKTEKLIEFLKKNYEV